MENKPKLKPLRLEDSLHNCCDTDILAKNGLSEKKPSKLQDKINETYIILSPIICTGLNVNQALEPSVGKTSAQSAISRKNNISRNTSASATDARRTEVVNKISVLQNHAVIKEQKEIIDCKQNNTNGIESIPVTPPQGIMPKNMQVMTPKKMRKTYYSSKVINDTPETYISFLIGLENNIAEGNEITSTHSKSNNLAFLKTQANSDNKDISILNPSENEISVVSLCDAFKRTLMSNSFKRIDPQKEQASLRSVMELVQSYLNEIKTDKEKTVNCKGNKPNNLFVNKNKFLTKSCNIKKNSI